MIWRIGHGIQQVCWDIFSGIILQYDTYKFYIYAVDNGYKILND